MQFGYNKQIKQIQNKRRLLTVLAGHMGANRLVRSGIYTAMKILGTVDAA